MRPGLCIAVPYILDPWQGDSSNSRHLVLGTLNHILATLYHLFLHYTALLPYLWYRLYNSSAVLVLQALEVRRLAAAARVAHRRLAALLQGGDAQVVGTRVYELLSWFS